MNKITQVMLLSLLTTNVFASNIIPMGSENNSLYYKIGGASDYALPPVSDSNAINLGASSNLGIGYSCSAFNPAVSVVNSLNNIKNEDHDLITQVIGSATGALISLPMYELSKHNPALYSLLNGKLVDANEKIQLTTKSCEAAKEQIDKGENPYHEWGTLAVNDQWEKHLSLTNSGSEDINQSKNEIDKTRGDNGIPWVTGNKDSNNEVHAGGANMPPIHAISDTIKAGYNAMLNRRFDDSSDAPKSGSAVALSTAFKSPQAASDWITSVVGDQIITTCNSSNCTSKQGSVVGHGLLPLITSCNQDASICTTTIRDNLGKLVTGDEALTKENLEAVSTDGIAVSPEVINSIQRMDSVQKSIIVNKLAQEIALQRVVDKAFIAKDILSAGAQIPVIAANHPAQVVIGQAISNLDNDIRSITFESQMRKQMISDTLTQVMSYSSSQKNTAMQILPVKPDQPMVEGGAIKSEGK
jgi:integrating conjugative element protein (TIGR03755 family)